MFKFLNRELFLTIINSWILDGSKLESFGSYNEAEWVVLRGADGAREEFYLFYTQETYDEATTLDGWAE